MSAQSESKAKTGKKIKIYSLVLITNEERTKVLLGLKKRGFGVNKYNGFGGKLTVDETIEECARREVEEECFLKVENLEKIGILVYDFIDSDTLMEVHFFTTSHYSGTVAESDEMKPKWFDVNNIPLDQMWIDDRYWFPYFLNGDHFNGYFSFKSESEIIYKCIFVLDKEKEIEPIFGPIDEPTDESVRELTVESKNN